MWRLQTASALPVCQIKFAAPLWWKIPKKLNAREREGAPSRTYNNTLGGKKWVCERRVSEFGRGDDVCMRQERWVISAWLVAKQEIPFACTLETNQKLILLSRQEER